MASPLEIVGVQAVVQGIAAFERDANSVNRLLAQINSTTIGLGKESTTAWGLVQTASNAALTGIATGAAVAISALTAISGATVGAAASFEEELLKAGAAVGLTASEVSGLGDTVLKVASNTRIGLNSISEAANQLARSGISLTDIQNGVLESTVKLSEASGGELGLAGSARLVSVALNAWGLSAKDVTTVTNTLLAAANSSAIGFTDMSTAFQLTAPLAASLHIPFQDLSITIAELGLAGVKGTVAGTALKTMLERLANPTALAAELMDKYKISIQDTAGKIVSLPEIIRRLQLALGDQAVATGKLTEADRAQVSAALFGTRSVLDALALADKGTDTYNKLADAVGRTDTSKVADSMRESLIPQLEVARNQFQSLLIVIGTPLEQALSAGVKRLNELVRSLDPKIPKAFADALLSIFSSKGSSGILDELNGALGPQLGGVFGGVINIVFAVRDAITQQLVPAFSIMFSTISSGIDSVGGFSTFLNNIATTITRVSASIARAVVLFSELVASLRSAAQSNQIISNALNAIALSPFIGLALTLGRVALSFAAIGVQLAVVAILFSGLEAIVSRISSVWDGTFIGMIGAVKSLPPELQLLTAAIIGVAAVIAINLSAIAVRAAIVQLTILSSTASQVIAVLGNLALVFVTLNERLFVTAGEVGFLATALLGLAVESVAKLVVGFGALIIRTTALGAAFAAKTAVTIGNWILEKTTFGLLTETVVAGSAAQISAVNAAVDAEIAFNASVLSGNSAATAAVETATAAFITSEEQRVVAIEAETTAQVSALSEQNAAQLAALEVSTLATTQRTAQLVEQTAAIEAQTAVMLAAVQARIAADAAETTALEAQSAAIDAAEIANTAAIEAATAAQVAAEETQAAALVGLQVAIEANAAAYIGSAGLITAAVDEQAAAVVAASEAEAIALAEVDAALIVGETSFAALAAIILADAIPAIGAALAAAAPVILGLAALAAVVAVVYIAFVNNFGGIKDFITTAVKYIIDRINEFIGAISQIPFVADRIREIGTAFTAVGNTIDNVRAVATPAINSIVDQVKKYVDIVLNGFPPIDTALANNANQWQAWAAVVQNSISSLEGPSSTRASALGNALGHALAPAPAAGDFTTGFPEHLTAGGGAAAKKSVDDLAQEFVKLLGGIKGNTLELAKFLAQLEQATPGRISGMVAALQGMRDTINEIGAQYAHVLSIQYAIATVQQDLDKQNAAIAANQLANEQATFDLKTKMLALDQQRAAVAAQLLPITQQIAAVDKQISDAQKPDYDNALAIAQLNAQELPTKQKIADLTTQINRVEDQRLTLLQRQQEIIAQQGVDSLNRQLDSTNSQLNTAWQTLNVPQILALEKQKDSLTNSITSANDQLTAIQDQQKSTQQNNELATIQLKLQQVAYEELLRPIDAQLTALQNIKDTRDAQQAILILQLQQQKASLEALAAPLQAQLDAINNQTAALQGQIDTINAQFALQAQQFEAKKLQDQVEIANLQVIKNEEDARLQQLIDNFAQAAVASGAFTASEALEVVKRLGFWNDSAQAVANIVTQFGSLKQAALDATEVISKIPRDIQVHVSFTQDQIPSFQYGGVVPGPVGAPQLIIAHGGEKFLGVGNTSPMFTTSPKGGAASGTVVNNYNVNATYANKQSPATIGMDLRALIAMSKH